MKSRLVVMLLVLVGFAFLGVVPNVFAQGALLVMKWGIVLQPEHPFVLGMKKTAEIVAQKTNNRIQIQVFPSAQLGTGKDMIEAVVFGSQALVTEGAADPPAARQGNHGIGRRHSWFPWWSCSC